MENLPAYIGFVIFIIVLRLILYFPITKHGRSISAYVIPFILFCETVFYYVAIFQAYKTNQLSTGLFLIALPIILLIVTEFVLFGQKKYNWYYHINLSATVIILSLSIFLLVGEYIPNQLLDKDTMLLNFFLIVPYMHLILTLFTERYNLQLDPKVSPVVKYFDKNYGLFQFRTIHAAKNQMERRDLKVKIFTQKLKTYLYAGVLILMTWGYVTTVMKFF